MNSATVYINKSYFRRANDCLISWPLDANYCRVRVAVKTCRNKLSATLSIAADFISANSSLFDRPTLRRSIPLGSLRETALASRMRGENNSVLVHCLTLRRQTNSLLSGSVVNLYQENQLEIDKIYSCLTALRQPLCTFIDLQCQESKSSAENDFIDNGWIVRLLNNLTVQSLGLCSDYLYVLRVTQEAFELQDVNQACILTCKMSWVASCSSLNGWFFVQFVGSLDQDACFDVEGGYLAMQCARSSQLLQLFQRLMGLSFGRRRWPSEPCLVKKATAVESTGAGRWPKREASFNVHRPRSASNRPAIAASQSPTPSPVASPRRLVGRFSFFRRQHQQQQQQRPLPTQRQLTSSARSPGSLNSFSQQRQQQLRVPSSPLSRHQSSSSVLSSGGGGSGAAELDGFVTSSSAETSSSSEPSSCRSAASVASLSALDGRKGGRKVLRHRRRQLLTRDLA